MTLYMDDRVRRVITNAYIYIKGRFANRPYMLYPRRSWYSHMRKSGIISGKQVIHGKVGGFDSGRRGL